MFKKFAFLCALLLAPAVPVYAQEAAQTPVVEVQITDAQLAAEIGEDLLPIVPTKLFNPIDTIYLSVSTLAPADTPGSLGVAWRYTYQGEQQAVHSEGRELIFSGAGVTVFEISKPDGWPDGEYSAEIILNGKSTRKLKFKVW